jgi:hypothetical protein
MSGEVDENSLPRVEEDAEDLPPDTIQRIDRLPDGYKSVFVCD